MLGFGTVTAPPPIAHEDQCTGNINPVIILRGDHFQRQRKEHSCIVLRGYLMSSTTSYHTTMADTTGADRTVRSEGARLED